MAMKRRSSCNMCARLMITELSRQDVEDILVGATLFGAGGGGELTEGLDLVDEALSAGKTFRLAALDDVPDDAVLCTPYLLGAISDLPQGEAARVGGHTHPVLLAVRRMRSYLDQPLFGMIACELGGSNTAVPFFVAAMEDAVVIDADPAGRAVPEITHSSYFLHGLPASPIVAANARGESIVLENIADDQRAETVVRALAMVSDNDIAAVDHALPAAVLKPALLPNTLSRSGRIGALLRAGRSDPTTLPETIASATGGIVAFSGMVSDSSWQTVDGFTLGSVHITGSGHFAGKTFRVSVKNENMIGWLDDVPFVTIPEIISILDTDTGDVVTNPYVHASQNVAVLVLPAPEIFLTPLGLRAFGPRYAGLDTVFSTALGGPDKTP